MEHLGIVQTVDSEALGRPLALVGQPVALTRTPSRAQSAAPERGEHTHEVLAEFGYSAREIEDLRRREVL